MCFWGFFNIFNVVAHFAGKLTHSEADRVAASLEDAWNALCILVLRTCDRGLCHVMSWSHVHGKSGKSMSKTFEWIPPDSNEKEDLSLGARLSSKVLYFHSARKVFRTQNTCKKPIPNTFAHRNFIELENQCSKSPYDLLNFQVLVFWVYDNVCVCELSN